MDFNTQRKCDATTRNPVSLYLFKIRPAANIQSLATLFFNVLAHEWLKQKVQSKFNAQISV